MPFYSQGFTLLFLSQSEVLVGRFEKSCHRLPLLWEDEKIIFVLCRTNSCVPRRANTPQIINSFPGFLFFKSCEWKKDPDTFKRDCRWPNNRCSQVHTRKSSLSNPPSNEMVTAAPPPQKKWRHYISQKKPTQLHMCWIWSCWGLRARGQHKHANMKPKGHHPAGEFRQAARIQVHKQ